MSSVVKNSSRRKYVCTRHHMMTNARHRHMRFGNEKMQTLWHAMNCKHTQRLLLNQLFSEWIIFHEPTASFFCCTDCIQTQWNEYNKRNWECMTVWHELCSTVDLKKKFSPKTWLVIYQMRGCELHINNIKEKLALKLHGINKYSNLNLVSEASNSDFFPKFDNKNHHEILVIQTYSFISQ